MTRPRSPSARRRAGAQGARLGDEIRTARATLGLSIDRAATLARVSWDTFRRAESGDPGLTILSACAIGEAVGLDVVIHVYPGTKPTLRDTGQLDLAQRLSAATDDTWQTTIELNVGSHGESIDMVCFGPAEILAIEIERLIVDWQAQFRRAEAKRLALGAQHGRPVRLIVAVEDTRRNRQALARHLGLIKGMLPAESRQINRSLRSGAPLGRDGLLWIRRRRPSG